MAGTIVGLLILVALLLFVTLPYLTARRRAPREGEQPVDQEVVRRLTLELRRAEAETAYWKAAAERLQREADGRETR